MTDTSTMSADDVAFLVKVGQVDVPAALKQTNAKKDEAN